MLRSLKDLERYAVSATDGDIGSVANFLLDDVYWTYAARIWTGVAIGYRAAA